MLKKVGDWGKAWKVINSLSNLGKQARIEAMKNLAQKGQRTIIQHIILQDLNWVALSEQAKRRKGHDRILIETGTYINNIDYFSDDLNAQIGVNGSVMYGDGTSLSEVAKRNEERYKKIPARPLWKPSSDELKAWQRSGQNDPSKILFNLLKAI